MKKTYPPDFKAQVVLEILKEKRTVTQVASEHSIHPTQLHRWNNIAVGGLSKLFTDENKNQNRWALSLEYAVAPPGAAAELGPISHASPYPGSPIGRHGEFP